MNILNIYKIIKCKIGYHGNSKLTINQRDEYLKLLFHKKADRPSYKGTAYKTHKELNSHLMWLNKISLQDV